MTNSLDIKHTDNGVVRLTLNRPEQNNALDEEMVRELRDSLRQLAKESSTRVLVLSGAGNHFCHSVDPNWVREYQNKFAEPGKDPGSKITQVMSELDNFPVPVVARINGDALGTGAGLAACCDMVICQKKSHFALNEVRAGLAPIASTPYIMACIGAHQARRWLLSGESMTSDVAFKLGLVHIRADDDKLDKVVDKQIAVLLQGAPGAQAEIKEWIKYLCIHGHHESATFSRAAGTMFRRCLNSAEAKNGINAWIEDEQPPWK